MGRCRRRTAISGIALICGMTLCSCSTTTEDGSVVTEPTPVEIVGLVGNKTNSRASQGLQSTALSTEVKMGLLAYNATAQTAEGTNPYMYTIAEGGKMSCSTTHVLSYPYDGTALNLYSFIPYNDATSSYSDKDATTYTFSILSDQTSDANYLASDLLYGSFLDATETNQPSIRYYHKTARLDVNLTRDVTLDMKYLRGATFSIVGVKPKVKILLSDGTVTTDDTAEEVSVDFLKIPTDASDDLTTFNASLRFPAQTFTGGNDFMRITFANGNTSSIKLKNTFTAVNGTYYPYSFTLSPTSVTIDSQLAKFSEVNITGSATEQ